MNQKLSLPAIALAAMLAICNNGTKNQNSDEQIIKDDVWNEEDIDFEEIVEMVDIKQIVSDESIAELPSVISGTSNDFIASDKFNRKTFNHIVDDRMTEKLNAAWKWSERVSFLHYFSYLSKRQNFIWLRRKIQDNVFQSITVQVRVEIQNRASS